MGTRFENAGGMEIKMGRTTNMRPLLVVGVMFAAIGAASGAHAQAASSCTTDASGYAYCDPASFHVSANGATVGTTGPGGIDWINTNNAVEFKVIDNNGDKINAPLEVFFAVPNWGTAPSVTNTEFDDLAHVAADNFGSLINFSVASKAGVLFTTGDLYTYVGCKACDNSLSFGNFNTALQTDGFSKATSFDVYELILSGRNFPGGGGTKDFEDFFGAFGNGTFIAPLAWNVGTNKTTYFDTSFTNTGLVDGRTIATGAPEPTTWAMMLAGFAFLGYAGYRGRRSSVAATL
jgi:hypothetical protein